MLRPIEDKPGMFELVSSTGKVLGVGRVVDGVFKNEVPHRRARKKIGIKTGKGRKPPHPDLVPGAWKREKLGFQTTKSGIVVEQSLWPSLVVVVKIGSERMRWNFFRFCKKHGLSYTPAFREPGVGEQWPFTGAYTLSGGPALGILAQLYPPAFVDKWFYVMDVAPPQLGARGVNPNAPMPSRKKTGFKWHEAGQNWEKMELEDLTEEQLSALDDGSQIINMMKRLKNNGGFTPYVWLLGCSQPIKWDDKDKKWVGGTSTPDLGKVPKPVLCKEWFGCEYRYFWVRSDGRGGQERSDYLPTSEDARRMLLDAACKWHAEEDIDERIERIDDGEEFPETRRPTETRPHYSNAEGWIGK